MSSVLFNAFSAISFSSMSSAPVMSDLEGSSSWALFRARAYFLDNGHSDMLKPKL